MTLSGWMLELRRFLEMLPVRAALYDEQRKLVFANELFRREWKDTDLTEQPCYRIWGKNQPCPNCPILSMLRNPEFPIGPVSFEVKEENEPSRYWHCLASLLQNEDGRRMGALVLFFEITRQRSTEERLQEQVQLAARHLEVYHTLFCEMLDACALHEMIFDAQGRPADYRFLDVNPSFEQMTGLCARDVVGRTVRETLPQIEPFWIETYGRVVLTGEPVYFSHFSGDLNRYYDVKAFRNAPGQFVCIFQDVTAAKHAEMEREKMRRALEQAQKMESIGRLTGGIAHDFNNMLNVILSYSELAIADVPLFDPLYDALSAIQKAARRSAALTSQLLAFARQQTASPRPVDIDEKVSVMLLLLRRLLGEDIELQWNPGGEKAAVHMDPAQLDQILTNLCVNARDAMPKGGRLTIATRTRNVTAEECRNRTDRRPGNYVELSVSDTGTGISPDIRDKIFEPFFTTKEPGKGTGLGLATVYGIVAQNGGFIDVESTLGEGTVFRVCLPVSAEPAARKTTQLIPVATLSKRERILLVEDEPEILAVTRKILERNEYQVITASSADDALHLVREHDGAFDLLITDVIMPEMNGGQLARRITERYPHIRCLFMSGYTAETITRQGLLETELNFIQKPFSGKELLVRIHQVLEKPPGQS